MAHPNPRVNKILDLMFAGGTSKAEDYNKVIPDFSTRVETMIQSELDHCLKLGLNPSDNEIAMTITEDFHQVWNDVRTVLANIMPQHHHHQPNQK
jgi:hypothetical protein